MNTHNQDISELSNSVNRFIGSQETWNKKHDQRSREVLGVISKNIDKLFTMNETLIKNFGELNCKEHSTRMEKNEVIADQKIKSVEKRVTWLWRIAGGTAVVALVRSIYEYGKNPF